MNNIDKDIFLKTLNKIGELSLRAHNVCASARLHTLEDIKLFYKSHRDFLQLEHCGSTINKELISLCEKNINLDIITTKPPLLFMNKYAMLLPEQKVQLHKIVLTQFSKLPPRLRNGISKVIHDKLTPENIIVVICDEGFDFKKIQNIGEGSIPGLVKFKMDIIECVEDFLDEEVSGISDHYDRITEDFVSINFGNSSKLLKQLFNNISPNKILFEIEKLSPFQRNILHKHIQHSLFKVSVRTKNAMAGVMDIDSGESILKTIFSDNFNLLTVRNVGDKSIREFIDLKNSIAEFINLIVNTDEEQLNSAYSILILNTIVGKLPKEMKSKIEALSNPFEKIKLFAFINLLIKNRVLIPEREQVSFYNLFINNEKPEINGNTDKIVTKERQRQIGVRLRDKIETKFDFVTGILLEDLVDYGLDPSKNLLTIDDALVNSINEAEDTEFNRSFYASIFKIKFSKTHTLIVNDRQSPTKKGRRALETFKCFFLINAELSKQFDFGKFIDDISLKTNEKISQGYLIPFNIYLSQFVLDKEIECLAMEEIELICKHILLAEFNLELNASGDLVFEWTDRRSIREYSYEVLEEEGKPMTISQMGIKIAKKYPDLRFKEDSLSGTMFAKKDVFICFGRTNTFGLKKWEIEKDNIKGGTIRAMVKEYLGREKLPKHIYDVYKFVKPFRENTYVRSVFDSMKSETSKPFIFFGANYVGLKSKHYPKGKFKIKKVNRHYFNLTILKKYNNWYLSKLIDLYVKEYGYERVQIEYAIRTKVTDGFIQLDSFDRIHVV